jgi:SlyX protein
MDARLTELEVKLSFAEDQIEALNLTVYRQQQQIDLLQEQIRTLRQELQASRPGDGESRSLRDELPPHY